MDQGTFGYGSNPALQQTMDVEQPNPGGSMSQQQVMQVPPQTQQAIDGMGPSQIGLGSNITTQQPGTSLGHSGAEGNLPGLPSIHKSALQQLVVVLQSPNTPEQQAQILQILKSNPQLMAAFIKQRQAFLQSQIHNQANPDQEPQLQQVIDGIGHSHVGPGPVITTKQPGTSLGHSGAEGNAPGLTSIHKSAILQLLAVLKSPNTPEKQVQILQILKSNPQLMAAFKKQRQAFQQTLAQNQANSDEDPEGGLDLNQLEHLLQHMSLQQ